MIMILDQGGNYCSPCNTIWKNVDKLPSLDEASRNHAYVLPDNTVWILNHDGTEFISSATGGNNTTIDLSSKQDKLTAGSGIWIHKKDDETIIEAMSPRDIKRYVVSVNGELGGFNSPMCVVTIEKTDPYNDFVSSFNIDPDVVTIDIITSYHVFDSNETETSYTVVSVPDEVISALNYIKDKHSKIVVGEIPIEIDSGKKTLTFKGLTKSNEHRAYSATYYTESHVPLP